MKQYKNATSLSVHITENCNMNCSHCYISKENRKKVIDIPRAVEAIKKIDPEFIMFYGGEPLLYPQKIKEIINAFPEKNFAIHTNGTIYNEELFDRVDILFVTVETFFYGRQNKYRKLNQYQWKIFNKILKNYKDKISITHNIYPKNNDLDFYKMVRLLGCKQNTHPIIIDTDDFNLTKEEIEHLKTSDNLLLLPKLRVLEDGTITRDMRGIYNICNVSEWKEEYRNKQVPVSEKCVGCSQKNKCGFSYMFPHFCKDIIDKNDNPFFCKVIKNIYE